MISTGEYAIILIGARIDAEQKNDTKKLEFIKREIDRVIKCAPYGWIVPYEWLET